MDGISMWISSVAQNYLFIAIIIIILFSFLFIQILIGEDAPPNYLMGLHHLLVNESSLTNPITNHFSTAIHHQFDLVRLFVFFYLIYQLDNKMQRTNQDNDTIVLHYCLKINTTKMFLILSLLILSLQEIYASLTFCQTD